jgi:hypothetical protein
VLAFAVAAGLITLLVVVVDSDKIDLWIVGTIDRRKEPVGFAAFASGLVVLAFLLIVLGAVLLVEGPVAPLVDAAPDGAR